MLRWPIYKKLCPVFGFAKKASNWLDHDEDFKLTNWGTCPIASKLGDHFYRYHYRNFTKDYI